MSILSLLYRTAGAWGAGKGSNLTAAEVDQNFYDLEQAVETLAATPPVADDIDEVTISGQALTFHKVSGATVGPITIPLGAIVWRGDWVASTAYNAAELFEATDPTTLVKGLYFVNRDFTSGLGFDPGLGTGIGGVLPYASFVLTVPDKVRIAWFWPTKPGQGLPILESSGDFAPMFSFLTVDSFYLPAGLTGSRANLRTYTNDATSYNLRKNGVVIGSVNFAGGSHTPTFTFADTVQFDDGDILDCEGPAAVDDLAECLSLTIVGTLGTFDFDSSSS
jgi:hypothetical protein